MASTEEVVDPSVDATTDTPVADGAPPLLPTKTAFRDLQLPTERLQTLRRVSGLHDRRLPSRFEAKVSNARLHRASTPTPSKLGSTAKAAATSRASAKAELILPQPAAAETTPTPEPEPHRQSEPEPAHERDAAPSTQPTSAAAAPSSLEASESDDVPDSMPLPPPIILTKAASLSSVDPVTADLESLLNDDEEEASSSSSESESEDEGDSKPSGEEQQTPQAAAGALATPASVAAAGDNSVDDSEDDKKAKKSSSKKPDKHDKKADKPKDKHDKPKDKHDKKADKHDKKADKHDKKADKPKDKQDKPKDKQDKRSKGSSDKTPTRTAAGGGDDDDGYSSDEWWEESGKSKLLGKLSRIRGVAGGSKKAHKDKGSGSSSSSSSKEHQRARERLKHKEDPRYPMVGYCDITVVRAERVSSDLESAMLYLTLGMSFPESSPTYQTEPSPYVLAGATGDEGEVDAVEWNELLSCVVVQRCADANFARFPKLVVRLKQKSALRDKVIGKGEVPLEHVIQPNKKGECKHSKDSEIIIPLLSSHGSRQGNVFIRIKFVAGSKGLRPES